MNSIDCFVRVHYFLIQTKNASPFVDKDELQRIQPELVVDSTFYADYKNVESALKLMCKFNQQREWKVIARNMEVKYTDKELVVANNGKVIGVRNSKNQLEPILD